MKTDRNSLKQTSCTPQFRSLNRCSFHRLSTAHQKRYSVAVRLNERAPLLEKNGRIAVNEERMSLPWYSECLPCASLVLDQRAAAHDTITCRTVIWHLERSGLRFSGPEGQICPDPERTWLVRKRAAVHRSICDTGWPGLVMASFVPGCRCTAQCVVTLSIVCLHTRPPSRDGESFIGRSTAAFGARDIHFIPRRDGRRQIGRAF